MALELSFDYSEQNYLKRLVFTDSTGVYNVTTNSTGWGTTAAPTAGSPEPYLKDIDYAVLEITDPADNEYTIDIITDLSVTFDGSTETSDLVYSVDNTDLGLASTAELTDGIWKVSYKVSDGGDFDTGNTAYITRYVGVYGKIEEYLMNYIKNIYEHYSESDTSYVDHVTYFNAIFTGMLWSAKCGDMLAFSRALTTLNRLKGLNYLNV